MTKKSTLLLLLGAICLGLMVALMSHAFLTGLTKVGELRSAFPLIFWTLPLMGLLMALSQMKFPEKFNWGVTQFLKELRQPQHRANPLLALWIFITSLLSHLGGASIGREGVGLIMSGSIADGFGKFKEDSSERSILLQSALSAGFTGMFGTPLAALVFIYELNSWKNALSPLRALTVAIATASTYLTSIWLKTPHTNFDLYTNVSWSGFFLMLFAVPVAAHLFFFSQSFLNEQLRRLGFWRGPLGGLLISLILFYFGTRYAGLGVEVIESAIKGEALPWDWICKLLLTTLAIAAGFKGGEVTPLFFIGATLGAWLGSYTGDADLAKLGMVGIFGSLTHTPLATGILALELFGVSAFVPAALITLLGQLTLKKRHLYHLK